MNNLIRSIIFSASTKDTKYLNFLITTTYDEIIKLHSGVKKEKEILELRNVLESLKYSTKFSEKENPVLEDLLNKCENIISRNRNNGKK